MDARREKQKTDGLQLNGHGRMQADEGRERGDAEKERWSKTARQPEIMSAMCVRGPYSFTHELSGGMRVSER